MSAKPLTADEERSLRKRKNGYWPTIKEWQAVWATLDAARAAFEAVDSQLEQAARVLGISELGLFFRVTLPLAWRGIMAGVLLAFARALGEFGATLMVAGSIPGKTQTLSIAVYEAVQAGQDDVANTLVLITSLVCVIALLTAGRLAPGRVVHRP